MILPENVRRAIVGLLVAGIGGYLCTQIWGSLLAIPRPVSANALQLVEDTLRLPAVRIPWLICLLLLIWVCWLAVKLKENPLDRSVRIRARYERDPNTNMMIHKMTGRRYCHTCLLKEPPVESELHSHDVVSVARCSVLECSSYYETPERRSHFAEKRRIENPSSPME
jgi:hypothetical protein